MPLSILLISKINSNMRKNKTKKKKGRFFLRVTTKKNKLGKISVFEAATPHSVVSSP